MARVLSGIIINIAKIALMKKILYTIILLLISLTASATGQEAEKIIIDGKSWDLLYCPIELDTTLSNGIRRILPDTVMIDGEKWKRIEWTSNWRRYIGEWEIKEGKLYLRDIYIEIGREVNGKHKFGEAKLPYDSYKDIFSDYLTEDGILALWVSDTLRAGKGGLVDYFHAGFDRTYEEEYILSVAKGVITDKSLYYNFHRMGVGWRQIKEALNKNFPWERFRRCKKVDKILIHTSDYIIDEKGTFIDCRVILTIGNKEYKEQSSAEIKAIKEILKSLYPWQLYYIYGKYDHSLLDNPYIISRDYNSKKN